MNGEREWEAIIARQRVRFAAFYSLAYAALGHYQNGSVDQRMELYMMALTTLAPSRQPSYWRSTFGPLPDWVLCA